MNIEEFLDYLEYERNYSINTIMAYRNNIQRFIDYCKVKNINNLNDVDYKFIRNYISYLYEKKYQAKSITRMISALRSFFKYLKKEDKVDTNPLDLITSPKVEKKLPKYLTINDVEKILNAPDMSNKVGVRDAFILELLYVSGIRVSELTSIKLNDISMSEKKIKIMGKGSKERIVYYGSRCQDLLNKYLNVRKEFLRLPNDFLILSNTGKQMSTREIRNIINRLKAKAGIDINISPHTFRHTFATHMLNEGADLRSVQELLGHENLSTTTIYTHLTNEKLRRTYLTTHPRAHQHKFRIMAYDLSMLIA